MLILVFLEIRIKRFMTIEQRLFLLKGQPPGPLGRACVLVVDLRVLIKIRALLRPDMLALYDAATTTSTTKHPLNHQCG